jgi:hypothetical protein
MPAREKTREREPHLALLAEHKLGHLRDNGFEDVAHRGRIGQHGNPERIAHGGGRGWGWIRAIMRLDALTGDTCTSADGAAQDRKQINDVMETQGD